MTDNLLALAGTVLIVVAGLAALALLIVVSLRALRRPDGEAPEGEIATLVRLQAETAVRIDAMREMLTGGN
jgi:hypothetical protein